MKDKANLASLETLLATAEASLAVHLAARPESKRKLLATLYSEIRSNAPRRKAYPSARDLFWDDPLDEIEGQCLSDALHVFIFLREHP